MDIWICPRFFQFCPPSGQKWRFSVKKWRFWGGVKNVKNLFFFLANLYIFKSSRKQCALRFIVFGPLVAKNSVFRYQPTIFGGRKNFANQKPISYNIFIYKMDIWIHKNFFPFLPLVAKNGVYCQKWDFGGGGVKNVKKHFFFLVHLIIFKSSRKQCTLRFIIFGPLVAFLVTGPPYELAKKCCKSKFYLIQVSCWPLLVGVWRVSERCLEGVWKVSETCLEGVWKVSGRYLEGIWKVSGRPGFDMFGPIWI